MARICIVTVSNLYSTPRVVKEADALAAAGHDVRVVYAQSGGLFNRPHDAAIEARSLWRSTVVTYNPDRIAHRVWWKLVGLRQKVCRLLASNRLGFQGLAERAVGRLYPELTRAAAAEAADLYIGHYPGGLAAAATAARRHGARLGYDLEDCYFIQLPVGHPQRVSIECVERRYLGQVAYLSASTRLIGEAFASQYDRRFDVVVRNCFDPIDKAPLGAPHDGTLRGFWFSQVISLRRGLDTVLAAIARCHHRVELDLRGSCYPEDLRAIEAKVQALNLTDRVRVLPPIAPDRLVGEATLYDIGFAAESDDDANRPLTASNKLFTYLAAGLAVAATSQPGQREALTGVGEAAKFYMPGDVDALAAVLEGWAAEPARLAEARAAAHRAAWGEWGWSAESRKLVAAVQVALADEAQPDPLPDMERS